jgi:hypothetical protein
LLCASDDADNVGIVHIFILLMLPLGAKQTVQAHAAKQSLEACLACADGQLSKMMPPGLKPSLLVVVVPP